MSPEKEGSGSIAKDVELVADAKGTSCLSYVLRCLLPPENREVKTKVARMET